MRKNGWNLTASSPFPQDLTSGSAANFLSLQLLAIRPSTCAGTNTSSVLFRTVSILNYRLLQPGLYVRRLLYVTLDDYLIVADEHRQDPRTRISMLPQEGVYFSKYANRRGANSAKSLLNTLLTLLALPHIGISLHTRCARVWSRTWWRFSVSDPRM